MSLIATPHTETNWEINWEINAAVQALRKLGKRFQLNIHSILSRFKRVDDFFIIPC
jgi:hypothetical protein